MGTPIQLNLGAAVYGDRDLEVLRANALETDFTELGLDERRCLGIAWIPRDPGASAARG